MTERERAIAWRRTQQGLLTDRAEAWRHGTLLEASDFPTYHDYNVLRVEDDDPGVEPAALAAMADELQAAHAHRRIEVDDEEAGRRLRPGFEVLGWRADRLAWLHRPATRPDVAAPGGVVALRPASFEETRPLRRAWKAEDPTWGDEPEFLLVEEAAARRGVRAVIADVEGPVGFTSWSGAGEVAEIELAFCLPEHRGRGIGAALLARTIAEAADSGGASDMFIVADDDGDSRRLYERLGFRTVWRQHVFTRLPAKVS